MRTWLEGELYGYYHGLTFIRYKPSEVNTWKSDLKDLLSSEQLERKAYYWVFRKHGITKEIWTQYGHLEHYIRIYNAEDISA
jgi:hypothetical protein